MCFHRDAVPFVLVKLFHERIDRLAKAAAHRMPELQDDPFGERHLGRGFRRSEGEGDGEGDGDGEGEGEAAWLAEGVGDVFVFCAQDARENTMAIASKIRFFFLCSLFTPFILTCAS
jgi:hypothetical protein